MTDVPACTKMVGARWRPEGIPRPAALPWRFHDGGRPADWPTPMGDCVTIAMSIVMNRPYVDVHAAFVRSGCNPDRGIPIMSRIVADLLVSWGWLYVNLWNAGNPMFNANSKRLLALDRVAVTLGASWARPLHMAALVGGTVYDSWDSARTAMKRVSGIVVPIEAVPGVLRAFPGARAVEP